ncbi:FAD-dependent oxidoreductase, partial [Christensenellaceae bacterium OttesenSCG-928-M15]|nr:FAD-dependent oxidoreductase [Christensenellaceae bacterium OttesenSCG-928-M15]
FKTERGKIAVDENCQTNVEGIYACGDMTVIGGDAASACLMGEIAAKHAMKNGSIQNRTYVPYSFYTGLEVAGIGVPQEYAELTLGARAHVGHASVQTLFFGEETSFLKVIIDSKYGEIVGAHAAGAGAKDMISHIKILMDNELTAYEAAQAIHNHPVFGTIVQDAFADAVRPNGDHKYD